MPRAYISQIKVLFIIFRIKIRIIAFKINAFLINENII
jgi:hypothetical protein